MITVTRKDTLKQMALSLIEYMKEQDIARAKGIIRGLKPKEAAAVVAVAMYQTSPNVRHAIAELMMAYASEPRQAEPLSELACRPGVEALREVMHPLLDSAITYGCVGGSASGSYAVENETIDGGTFDLKVTYEVVRRK